MAIVRGSGRRLCATLLAVGLTLQGCASPGRPVTQTVRVETPSCALVWCEPSNDPGSWQVPRTPDTVTLSTSHATLKVSCLAERGAVAGGLVGGAAVGAAVGAAALTFIAVLGVIVVPSGVAAGAATGQAVESNRPSIRSPELTSVPMSCPTATAAMQPAAAALGIVIRGPQPGETRDVGAGERGTVPVTSVAAGSHAASAGLHGGDILLSAGGLALRDAADLQEGVLTLAPGAPLAPRVWCDGQVLELALTRPAAAP
jgi:hypothetical protein